MDNFAVMQHGKRGACRMGNPDGPLLWSGGYNQIILPHRQTEATSVELLAVVYSTVGDAVSVVVV